MKSHSQLHTQSASRPAERGSRFAYAASLVAEVDVVFLSMALLTDFSCCLIESSLVHWLTVEEVCCITTASGLTRSHVFEPD